MLLLLAILPIFSFLLTCCFKSNSIRTQAKKKYKPGHIPVFEDPEKPENSTQYDMKTERFFPKKGEENPFEEDCKEKTEKDNMMQMQPSSGSDDKKPVAVAAPAAAAPTGNAVAATQPMSPTVQSTQPSVPSPTPAK